MSALISAFNSLPTTRSLQHSTNTPSSSSTPLSNQSPTLQHTIFTAEKILNSSNVWQQADPRAVGSTSLHNDRLLLSNVPSHSRASGVWRNDRLIHKNPHGNTTRTPLSEKAKAALERWFTQHLENPYPDVAQKLELARECSMTLSSVNNWFGNKRMRIKRKMLNVNNSEAYPGSETRSISDKVLAPRSKWNAVVVSKMNSQAGREVVASATGRANVYSDEHDVVASGVITTSEQPRSMPLHDQRIHPSAPPSHGLENLQ